MLRRNISEVAAPDGAVNHVYARPGKNGMDLVLFVASDTVEAAEASARASLEKALAGSGQPFVVTSCAVDLLIPAAEALLDRDDD